MDIMPCLREQNPQQGGYYSVILPGKKIGFDKLLAFMLELSALIFKENSFMSFYITNELPPKKKISSVQSNPMKHCTEYSVI